MYYSDEYLYNYEFYNRNNKLKNIVYIYLDNYLKYFNYNLYSFKCM